MLSHRLRALGLSTAALAITLGISAPAAVAAESIGDYAVSATLTPEAVMTVDETITYDFAGQADRHGIQRDLVLRDSLSDGSTQVYGIDVTAVTANGTPVPFTSTDNGDFLSVRIGDPDQTVSGTVTYDISYSVTGALHVITAEEATADSGLTAGDVELYWDMIGDGWGIPIASATATVHASAPAVAALCFYGPAGSGTQCAVTDEGGDLVTEPVALADHESLTLVAAYPASAFTVVPAPTIEEPYVIPGFAWIISLAATLLVFLAPLGWVLSKRRKLRGSAFDGAPVQFEAPDSVRPAQLQAAVDGHVDARGAVATMLDLTARGYLTMSTEKGGLLSKDSLTITRATTTDQLAPWEEEFLAGLLGTHDTKTLAGYDATLAATLERTSHALVLEAEAAGRRSTSRNHGIRAALIGIGVAAVGLAFLLLVLLPGGSGVLALIPAIALLVSCLIAARLVPARETVESANFQSRAQGFRKLLDTDAAEARREFTQRSGLQPFAIFATMLPYAVIFGLDESWTQAFPEITVEQMHSAGFYFASGWVMHDFIDSAQGSLVQASTEPSRSSGSGFSGGSSGGGGGGGGGGSW